jgi:hypothetical protein
MIYRPTRDVALPVPALHATRDLITREGATELAAELDLWWHSRGFYTVRHTVEWIAFDRSSGKRSDQLGRSSGAWIVKSNLVNGLPP